MQVDNPPQSAQFNQPGCSAGTLGSKRPFIPSIRQHGLDQLSDQLPIRKSTLLKDVSGKSPILSVPPDPNKLVSVWLHHTNSKKSERQRLWKKFLKSSSTFCILWLELFKIPNGKLTRQVSSTKLIISVYDSINSIEAGVGQQE